MIVSIEANTDGKGAWTEEARTVLITKLDIGFSSLKMFPESPFHGELRAYFDPSGYTPGSWNVSGYGLVYGDKLWLKEFKKGLRELGLSIKAVQSVKYYEQELQGNNYVALDIGAVFYASWQRITKELAMKEDADTFTVNA